MNASNPFGLLRALGMLSLLYLAGAAAQSTLVHPIHNLLGAQPDFLLTIVLCAALLSDAGTGCVAGFVGGLISATLTGQIVGTLLVTRTIAGFLAGRLTARVFEANTLIVMLGVLVTSLITSLIQTLIAPQRMGLAAWLLETLGGAVWNALISLPIAALLRWSGWGGPNPRLR